MSDVLRGACFCGAVEIELTGAPDTMGHCHSLSCRSWSGDPVHAYTLWQRDNVVARWRGSFGDVSLVTGKPESLSVLYEVQRPRDDQPSRLWGL
ncbi:MAG: hypothetical protein ACI915_000917 [Gammaproteobacteria bacterium]|jgi:hypothetical protein